MEEDHLRTQARLTHTNRNGAYQAITHLEEAEVPAEAIRTQTQTQAVAEAGTSSGHACPSFPRCPI